MIDAAKLIGQTGILPVLNIKDEALVEPLAQVLLKHGIYGIEVLFRNEKAVNVLKKMKATHPEMAVGAGTVMTVAQAQIALDAGADFIVCPGYVQSLVDFCNEHGILIVPGCTTASEIQCAYASGLRTVKFFPAEMLGGVKHIEEYAKVFKEMKFVPTNGITMDNFTDYLKKDFVLACGGSFMAPASALDVGNFEKIDALCAQAVERSLGFSLAHVGINADGNEDAQRIAAALSSLFLFPVIDHSRSVFSGAAVECMKENGRGAKGHIGFRTLSVDRAVAYLERKGVKFAMETAGYDEKGSLKFVYLQDEIAGFAIHLVK